MRRAIATILLLLVPVASAADQVHVTWVGDEYAVTYRDNATGAIETLRVPATAGGYTLDGVARTLPLPPAADESVRIVYVADMGTDRHAAAIVRAIVNVSPSLVILGGDLSYAHGDAEVWDKWFRLIEPLASTVPTMLAFGNHESYCDLPEGGYETCEEEQAFVDERFELPNGDRFYYALDWGPLHLSVLDTEAYVEDDLETDAAEQDAWLRRSLTENGTRWNVVAYHRAIRTTNLHEGADVGTQRAHLEPILDGGADLVLQAHVHAYEREKPRANGTVFVTSGGGGRQTYEEWEPMPEWLATRAAEHHFLVVDATPTRIDVRAVRPDNSTLDSFSLERAAPAVPTPSPTPPATPTPTGPASSPSAAPTATPPTNGTAPVVANGSVEEANTPFPWPLALVAVMLSARLLRGRFLRTGR